MLIPANTCNGWKERSSELFVNKIQKEINYVNKSLKYTNKNNASSTLLLHSRNNFNRSIKKCFSNQKLECNVKDIIHRSPTERFVEKGGLMDKIAKSKSKNNYFNYNLETLSSNTSKNISKNKYIKGNRNSNTVGYNTISVKYKSVYI